MSLLRLAVCLDFIAEKEPLEPSITRIHAPTSIYLEDSRSNRSIMVLVHPRCLEHPIQMSNILVRVVDILVTMICYKTKQPENEVMT